MPFQHAYGHSNVNNTVSVANHINVSHTQAYQIKKASENSKVPFSPQMRIRSDDAPAQHK